MDQETTEVLHFLTGSDSFPRLKGRSVKYLVHDFVQSHPDFKAARVEMSRKPNKK